MCIRDRVNPDALSHRHAVDVKTPTGMRRVVPILQIDASLVDALRVDDPFEFLRVKLVSADGEVFDMHDTDYVARVRQNSDYIIHPEEILADNFALLCRRRAGEDVVINQPLLVDQLEAALQPHD